MFLQILNQLCFWILHADTPQVFPKPLTQKEELACFQAMEQNNQKARHKLIEHNLRLVAHIVKKYRGAEEQEELISIGTFGLMKAVDTFDYHKGSKFSTYASRCVENEILMHFRAQKKHASDLHMNEPTMTDKDGNALTLMDTLEDGTNLEEQVDFSIHAKQLYSFLDECLDKRELEIMILRYGLYGHIPLTQKEVAKKLNISRSYVSRLEKKALGKLKTKYEITPFT
ncbi:MAG: RNA polymerase sporulation sigma factor SigK [Oscillospiraceae bacterium]|nr:RNA polymerase sporulation sigma factor SigK [Oscillospiraceae bacterium]